MLLGKWAGGAGNMRTGVHSLTEAGQGLFLTGPLLTVLGAR
jgi:hypothetical protein